MKKEKTNQYTNETELKSLIIRINNKAFLENLSSKFKRLDKYLQKYSTNTNVPFKYILENNIFKVIESISKNRYKQLLHFSDDEWGDIKNTLFKYKELLKNSSDYSVKSVEIENTKLVKDILSYFNDKNLEMRDLNNNLKHQRKNDSKRLRKYIQKHTKSKSQKFKRILREHIIGISERNLIDKSSYERFGEMILLIIKNILKKPKFSGYTYRDEFYSDSTDKIIRYLKNFNHKMISDITGIQTNAFSYISQYVHNSILFIIKTKNTEKQEMEKYVNTYNENITLIFNESSYIKEESKKIIDISIIYKDLYNSILMEIEKITNIEQFNILNVLYPQEYKISLEEYSKISKLNKLLNKQISVIRKKEHDATR